MTDPSEDGNYLVRVRAQVMSRDDSSGGWVPLGGGGLSNVSVRKRPRPVPSGVGGVGGGGGGPGGGPPDPGAKPKHDYLICGKRISDNTIVLSCTIKKDFEYNKVMPTFHHWKTGDKKFGLTFQTAADARAFDKGVKTAVEDLLDGFADTSPLPPLPKCTDVGDDDVFMTLDLPQDPKDSRSSSDSSTKGTEHLHRITYIGRDKPPEPRQSPYETGSGGSENYPYVQLTAVHEYIYPAEDQQKPALFRRDSTPSLKKGTLEQQQQQHPHQPPLPHKTTASTTTTKQHQLQHQHQQQQYQHGKSKLPIRCRYCQDYYTEDKNPRGACEYAPDLVRTAIERITCIECAQCVGYHCASDAEGDFAQHPCDCANDENCARRWFCVAMLSVFVPCLWLYPPLKMCHWCGVRCGACGGRHAI